MGSPAGPAPETDCAVCFNRYEGAGRAPKVLPCHRAFCLECLARIHRKGQPPASLPWPLCRRCTRLPASGPAGLASDLAGLAGLPGQLGGRPEASRGAVAPQSPVSSVSRSVELGPRPWQERPRRAEPGGGRSCSHGRPCLALLGTAALGTAVLLVGAVPLVTVPPPSRAGHNLTAPSPPGGPPQGAPAAGGARLARDLAKPDPVSAFHLISPRPSSPAFLASPPPAVPRPPSSPGSGLSPPAPCTLGEGS